MNLYEVIHWGSHGKADSEDTIYLVRASGFRAAIEHVQRNTSPSDRNGKSGQLAHIVYELGMDSSPLADSDHPRTLRGPYFKFAYNYGWKSWERKIKGSEYTNEWEEKPNIVA
jgi:hypothetical protein